VRRGIAAVERGALTLHKRDPAGRHGWKAPFQWYERCFGASGWKDGRRPRRTLQREEAERSDLLRVAACVLSGEEEDGWASICPRVEMVVRLGAVRNPFSSLFLVLRLIFVFIQSKPRDINSLRLTDAPSNGAGHAQTPTRITPPPAEALR
jgi:hypothetical protein